MNTLSRVHLDPSRRGARKLIGNPQAMHAAVMAAFSAGELGDSGRVLWRLDSDDQGHVVYLSGPGVPDLRVITDQAGRADHPGDTADLRPFLNALAEGQTWAFRLTANPVKSIPQGPNQRGRVVPHVTVAQQLAWLEQKSSQHGFTLCRSNPVQGEEPSDTPLLDAVVSRRMDLRFSKGSPAERRGPRVTIRTARFDGRLEVTDAELLRRTLLEGIGRARAYGCGLLSLAQPALADV